MKKTILFLYLLNYLLFWDYQHLFAICMYIKGYVKTNSFGDSLQM